eukprot:4869649-Lingulodinium_polyedra.AAC.1
MFWLGRATEGTEEAAEWPHALFRDLSVLQPPPAAREGLALDGPEAGGAPSGKAFTDGVCFRGHDTRLRRAGFGFVVFAPGG